MILPISKLTAKLEAMSPEDLRDFAYNVVCALYGDTFEIGFHDADEATAAGIKEDGEKILDSEKEWSVETIEYVAQETDKFGIHPGKL